MISTVQAFALSHRGKATSDVTFNSEDGPEAYSNPSAYSRLQSYSEVARELRGPEFDPFTEPIDGEALMRAGGGKKNGRYLIADSLVDTATTPTLAEVRARSTQSSPAIRPRPTAVQAQLDALQVFIRPSLIYNMFYLCSNPLIICVRHGCKRRWTRGCRPSGRRARGWSESISRGRRVINTGWTRPFSTCQVWD